MDASTLTDRLRGILKPRDNGSSAEVRLKPDATDPLSLEQALGGEWHRDGSRRCFVVERRVEADALHGDVRIHDCAAELERSMTRASLLMRNLPAPPPFLFFDLETTGLSGGAGTYAFLVGCGWFAADGAFMTRQYFLADSGDEKEMLQTVAAEFGRAGVLVSFNGKSFDAPVLETRYLLHRLDWIGGGVPHLDVLHPARRFWGGGASLDSGCSLGALERRLVGARREGDVPGLEIPARYFQFVRSGDARPLSAVLEHNRLDLISLAALTARLLQLVHDGAGATGDTQEALALGHVYGNSGLDSRAREAYRRAVTLSTAPVVDPSARSIMSGGTAAADRDRFDGVLRMNALRALAISERRARAYDDAARCWQGLLDLPECPPRIAGEAAEALAIHHEHRRRDLEMARAFALRSLKDQTRPAWNDAVQHRLARLNKKLGSPTEPPLFPSSSLQPSFGSPTSGRQTSS